MSAEHDHHPESLGVDRLSLQELRASREAWWTERFTELVWSHIGRDVQDRWLEVGCGTGILSKRLRDRLDAKSVLVGTDLDPLRVKWAHQAVTFGEVHPSSTYCVADGRRLPFADGSYSLSISILTLQHVPDPEVVLGEMKRVTRPGGSVVCVEPDNVTQRICLPRPQPTLDDALLAFWRRVGRRHLPADMAVGPSLPGLFKRRGLGDVTIEGYLITRTSWSGTRDFFEHASTHFESLSKKYQITDSPEMHNLRAVLKDVEETFRGSSPFYSLWTVPLFLVKGRA